MKRFKVFAENTNFYSIAILAETEAEAIRIA